MIFFHKKPTLEANGQLNVHLITTVICGISSGEFFLVTTFVNGDFEKKFEINGKKIKFIQDQYKGPAYKSND